MKGECKMLLKDKVAIVTGGSRGIGFAIVEAYVREGARVAVCGSRMETAKKAVDTLQERYPDADLLPIGANMSDSLAIEEMVKAVVDRWGKIDILVNNAGITASKSIFDMTDEDFETMIDINLNGPFKCTREVAKVMKETGGCIINTSSLVGTYASRMQTAYSASKFGINGLTKACARELGPYRIRVNAVAPGVVGTDMVAEAVSDQMLAALKGMTPLGRMADPAELAGAYVYLASDAASFTTGAILAVDGGIVM